MLELKKSQKLKGKEDDDGHEDRIIKDKVRLRPTEEELVEEDYANFFF